MLNFPSSPAVGQIFAHCIWDGEKWTNTPPSSIAVASTTLPLVNDTASPGDDAEWAHGDHVHPIDASRASKVGPTFTGTVNAAAVVSSGQVYANGIVYSNIGRTFAKRSGAVQPSAWVHSVGAPEWGGRGVAGGMFLDTSNYLAFGFGDGAGNPTSNVARFDNSGNFWANSIALGRAPTSGLEAASKSYVDTRPTGAYYPMTGGVALTGLVTMNVSPGSLTQGGGAGSLEVRSPTGNDSVMTFHRQGAFAAHFGLRIDNNFWYGGLSYGEGQYWRLWSTRDFGGAPCIDHRLVYAGDPVYPTSPMQEPYNCSVITAFGAVSVGPGHQRRHRWVQFYSTSWFTIAYA